MRSRYTSHGPRATSSTLIYRQLFNQAPSALPLPTPQSLLASTAHPHRCRRCPSPPAIATYILLPHPPRAIRAPNRAVAVRIEAAVKP
jgi:hypothetical protein